MPWPFSSPQLPLALSETWIAERHLSGEALRFLPVVAEEGGAEFAAGSIVLIDCDQVIGGPGAIFAMNIGGETQLRRIVRRLSSSVELVHINPSWPTETVKKIADAPILGAVVFAFGPV